MKLLLRFLFIMFLVSLVSFGNSTAGTIICPESSIKCTVTETQPDGTSRTIESEKGAKRGAIEIE